MLFATGAAITAPASTPSPTATTSGSPQPSPSPSSSPSASATTFPGGGSLVATFTANYPPAARSATFTFGTASGTATTSVPVALPSGCASTSPCTVTLPAPAGTTQLVQVSLYASANETGAPLATGSVTSSIFAGQATSVNFVLGAIAATSSSITVSPTTLTVGHAATITVAENLLDAAGEVINAATNFSPTVSVIDPSNILASTLSYNGIGSGSPITITVQAPGFAAESKTLNFTPPTPVFNWLCAVLRLAEPNRSTARVSPGSTAVRSYGTPCSTCNWHPRFDPNGTLWGYYSFGINPDGTSAGKFAPSGTLLAFDFAGKAYVADPSTNAIDVYSGSTLVRQINLPAPPAAVQVDPSGNVYVALATVYTIPGGGFEQVLEYGPSGSGSISPVAILPGDNLPAFDSAGNEYVAGAYVYAPGTFGTKAPARVLSYPPLLGMEAGVSWVTEDFGVDASGDIYALAATVLVQPGLPPQALTVATFYAAAGSTVFTMLVSSQISYPNYSANLLFTFASGGPYPAGYIAVPFNSGSSQGVLGRFRR